jgi:outer membrane protein OmpA-like peptidoglycan-associated protein
MRHCKAWLTVAIVLIAACPTFGQKPKPPAELNFLTTWSPVRDGLYESWGEVTFPKYGPNQVQKRGRHWSVVAFIPTGKNRIEAWTAIKPIALKAGWTIASENPNGGFLAVLRSTQNGLDAWANLTLSDKFPGYDIIVDLVEVCPPPISLTLAEPAPTPEPMPSPGKGFPYLAPLPGSKPHGGGVIKSPFYVKPKGADKEEIVASSSVNRSYGLDGLSNALFTAVYREALTKAGWEIHDERVSADATMLAHYSRKGRNIWARLHNNNGGYDLEIADPGGSDQLKSALTSACHVALYGVLFDFNKSTLQPASDGPLQQVAALMTADKTLKLEVQGHTDNVGTDAYNQTLSESRAKSVVAWLSQHAVTADRLNAKGYGMTMPVADNKTDEGRAKNRRVEIADPRCSPKSR